jgi:hypothetical protein
MQESQEAGSWLGFANNNVEVAGVVEGAIRKFFKKWLVPSTSYLFVRHEPAAATKELETVPLEASVQERHGAQLPRLLVWLDCWSSGQALG